MRAGKSLSVSSADAGRLRSVVQDRNAPQKHVWRAEIVLLTADGVGTNAIMRRTGKSKTCVWRWQERFIEEGFDGLLRDKTRPSRIKPLGVEAAERVVALTLAEPPGETTHWTGVLMSKAAGLSVSSVQRIWRAHGLQPHRMRQFKLSNDPRFVDKLRDVVGLYVDPPAHAIVLSVDEKSQIQALDRTQPGLPLKKGTIAADYNFGQLTAAWTKAFIPLVGGKVIGEEFVPLSVSEFSQVIARIQGAKPDWVMTLLVGQNQHNYYPQAAAADSSIRWPPPSIWLRAMSTSALLRPRWRACTTPSNTSSRSRRPATALSSNAG